MTITVPGIPSSQKTPGSFLNVILGGAGTSAGVAPDDLLLLGNLIGSITATLPTDGTSGTEAWTTTAGTATAGVVVPVFSASDAAAKFGTGSELHRMALAVFAAYPTATVYACPVAEGSGTAATGVITPTISSAITAAHTLRVTVCGRSVDVPVTTLDTVSTLGLALARAINRQADWPVTAVNVWATGAVTLTAKNKPRGTAITFRVSLIDSARTVKCTAGALAGTLDGLTITLSGGTATGGVYVLGGSMTADDVTAALAAVASRKFARYVVAATDGTNLGLVAAQLDTLAAGSGAQFGQQAVMASVGSYATAVAAARALNRSRCQLAWLRYADDLPCEIAAAVAAARLAGDGAVSGGIAGESSYPAANLNGLEVAALRAQDVVSDQTLATEVESALNNGVSPLVPSSARPGGAVLVAAITTRSMDGQGMPNFGVYKCSQVGVPDWCRERLRAWYATTYRATKLVADTSDGLPPRFVRYVTPSMVRDGLLIQLKGFEEQGNLANVNAHKGEIACAINPSNPRRLDCDVPIPVPEDFDILAGNLRQITP